MRRVLIHDYYSLIELSNRWSKLLKTTITPRDIIRLGATGKLQVQLLTLGLDRHYDARGYGLRKQWHDTDEMDLSLYDVMPLPHERSIEPITKFEQLSQETMARIEAQSIDRELLAFSELTIAVSDCEREMFYAYIPSDSILTLTNYIKNVLFSISDLYVLSDEVERYEQSMLGSSSGEKSSKISEPTLYLIIALLKKELLREKGRKQDALIMDMIETSGDLKGISKSTLEMIFAEANREEKKRL